MEFWRGTATKAAAHLPSAFPFTWRTLPPRRTLGLAIHPGMVLSQPADKFIWRERAAIEIALSRIATYPAQKLQLLFRFYAFRDHFHAQLVAYLNALFRHDPIAAIHMHVLHKIPVDLQFCRGDIHQLLHHGIAGAKVVDRQMYAFHSQPGQHVKGMR